MDEYGAYKDDQLGNNAMERLQGLAEQQAAAVLRVETITQELKEAKANLQSIAEVELPDLMDELGIAEFKTSAGYDIKVTENIRGSIPKKTEADAFAWLDENGYEKLIKRQFQIEFGKNEEEWAGKFEEELTKHDRPLHIKKKRTIHPQTLWAFVSSELKEGTEIPMELFGVYRQRIAKIKVPK